MKSIMNHQFSKIPAPQIQRSSFDRSHGLKTAFNAGYIIPMFLDEILPGDTLKLNATFLARLSTFIFPIMDNIFLDTFWFFVPMRLLWQNWERFNGSQPNPGDSIDFTMPILGNTTAFDTLHLLDDTLSDYFGLPTNVDYAAADRPTCLPHRAYTLIWNEWFRDQNLQNRQTLSIGDGPDFKLDHPLQKRGKRHDYFTSCLPWPQKGSAVTLPLGDTAPIYGDGQAIQLSDGTQYGTLGMGTATWQTEINMGHHNITTGTSFTPDASLAAAKYLGLPLKADGHSSHMYADLASATSATINSIRQAFAFQKILERDARGGTRYMETLKARWGVTAPDYRLQRPEYLGGNTQRINVSAVQQTSGTNTAIATETPQANLSAYSVAHHSSGFNKSFVEHGYVIGLVNVRADITYQNGLNRLWSRKTRYDHYLPELAHLGEQAVMTNEIHYKNGGSTLVFGYQERWAEYRYKPSYTTGAMRSNHALPLDSWHLALDFAGTPPTLNDVFIVDNPPINRVVAVSSATAPQIIMDSYFSMKHTRPLPVYSVPGQMDRF